ncbi:MAG TPA: hypothetical protein VI895_03330 [Bdellovibrionota bacterium]|nr:hypothetical protein [Bdellovibrionota bacterium]
MYKAILLLSFMLVSGAYAHEAKHHVMGSVTAIDSAHVELKTTEGKLFSAQLAKETHFVKDSKPATLSDVKVGARAVVYYNEGESPTAVKVQLPPDK